MSLQLRKNHGRYLAKFFVDLHKLPIGHRAKMWSRTSRATVAYSPSKLRHLSSSTAPRWSANRISDEDMQRFEEDGALVLRGLFTRKWIDKLREAAELNLANPGPLCDEHAKPGTAGRFHDDQFLWKRHDVMREFVHQSPAAQIARAMTRAKSVRLFYDQLFIKEPGTSTKTPWHNDHSYWPLRGEQIISLWLALDHIPKSACVQYVKGSHKWKLVHRIASFSGDEDRYKSSTSVDLPGVPDIDNKLDEVELLTWDLDPGDCLIHQSFAVHGAPGISSPTLRRRAYATRWVGDQVVFDPRPGTMQTSWMKVGYDPGLKSGDSLCSELFPEVAFET